MSDYLTNGPVSPEQISAAIENLEARQDTGGHSIFLGQVRADLSGEKRVKAIEYSAYEAMVHVEVNKIKEAIFREFSDVLEISLTHSTGTVKAGEISLFVLVSAGHRDHAIRACASIVEMIKEKLPVWKKEIYDDDSSSWKGTA